MLIHNNRITVFEHQKLVFNLKNKVEKDVHKALETYHGSYSPFFSLIRNGVQFNEHVGVLQVGKISIEVLPKADKEGEKQWRNLLIDMIRTVWGFEVKATGFSSLNLKSNSVLNLYFELFVNELELILHKGLIKKYNRREGNQNALKGSLQFSKHIRENLVHSERFFVRYTEYNREHIFHQILYKALRLIHLINQNPNLKSRISVLLLDFPEQKDIKITNATFSKLNIDRKSIAYQSAIDIAKLILLNYHPDLAKGDHHVLALMFDMNLLWEQFVLMSLKKKLKSHLITSQVSKSFWKPDLGYHSKIRPDIVLQDKESKEVVVLDTKWKNLNGYNPSPEDLRQMYVYHRFYKATKTALIYPSAEQNLQKGNYYSSSGSNELSDKQCSVIQIKTEKTLQLWQEQIISQIKTFIEY